VTTLLGWTRTGLRNVRFSGGEPTLHPMLGELVRVARGFGVQRIAISTNGSASRDTYDALLRDGVNDVSVSLDACCSETAERMAGRLRVFDAVTETIRWLSSRCYVTVGVVVNEHNAAELPRTIELADSLGVADIRIIPAAQDGERMVMPTVRDEVLDRHPILRYRIRELASGGTVRGLSESDCGTCHLLRDDCLVAGRWHFPCVIHFREGGDPIGEVGPAMRRDRIRWLESRDSRRDPICRANCLDVCREYNNRARDLRQ
jgi:molybdenum cofactor biosynthesis enzyme MoaA